METQNNPVSESMEKDFFTFSSDNNNNCLTSANAEGESIRQLSYIFRIVKKIQFTSILPSNKLPKDIIVKIFTYQTKNAKREPLTEESYSLHQLLDDKKTIDVEKKWFDITISSKTNMPFNFKLYYKLIR